MKRIFHNYKVCEEYEAGMWRNVTSKEREKYSSLAAELMIDVDGFTNAMRRASQEWTFSCEHSLSDTSMNRLAWLGHAGCCISLGSPEDATRKGWWMLNQWQQDRANEAAASVIKEWEERQCQSDQLELMY